MNLSTVCGESSFRVDRKKLNEKSNLKSEKKTCIKIFYTPIEMSINCIDS